MRRRMGMIMRLRVCMRLSVVMRVVMGFRMNLNDRWSRRMRMVMPMPTQLRQLLRLRRHMTITKRIATIIHTRTHTHEQP